MDHGSSNWTRKAGSVAAALLLGTASAMTQSAPRRVQGPHTTVELIADRQPDAATRELWMALRFELEQGWHVYWQNPGDSGGPPEVLWEPPPQFKIGEFEWPAPDRILVGPLVNYGYTNELVLPFRVQLAKPADPKAPATVTGQATWLICHEICVPGKARLAMTLPMAVADRGQTATWRQQIEEARQHVPGLAPATWRPRATRARDEFALTFTAGRANTQTATFFPLEISRINDSAPQVVTRDGENVTIRLKVSDQMVTEPRVLRGVIELGPGEAYVVEAPVAPPITKQGPRN